MEIGIDMYGEGNHIFAILHSYAKFSRRIFKYVVVKWRHNKYFLKLFT